MKKEIQPILVIDDDAFQRRMIRIKLQTRGYEVNEAKDGTEAINFLAQQKYALVLLDIVMPQLNGREVLDQIRSRFQTDELPVIMMTAQDNTYDMAAAISRGANSYLTKPIDFASLDTQIDNFLNPVSDTVEKVVAPPTAQDTQSIRREISAKTSISEPQLSLLQGLTNNLPGVIFRVTADSEQNVHLTYQSDGLKCFLGKSWNNVQEIIATADNRTRSKLNKEFVERARNLDSLLFRFESRSDSGRIGWVECRGTPHRLPSGETVWDALFLDVTEAMQLERRLENSRATATDFAIRTKQLAQLQKIADAGAELATAIQDGTDSGPALRKLRAAQATTNPETIPLGSSEAAYRDANGFISQCSRCRKVQNNQKDGRWELVAEWQKHMPPNTSHAICPSCANAHLPVEID